MRLFRVAATAAVVAASLPGAALAGPGGVTTTPYVRPYVVDDEASRLATNWHGNDPAVYPLPLTPRTSPTGG